MDTSETYIKMCEKAEEMQKLAPDEKSYGANYYSGEGERFCACQACDDYWRGTWVNPGDEGCIWLPRQDQLQEMGDGGFEHGFIDWIGWLKHIYHWDIGSLTPKPFITWEQLWLAFVMKEKYNKVWDGEKWINEE